jgi:hypothetical protein
VPVLTGRKRRITLGVATSVVAVVAAGLAPVQATAAPDTTNAHVRTVSVNPDGTVTETLYHPAPGFTAAQLASSLRVRGVANVSVSEDSESADAAAVAPCSLGTARTWPSTATCFVRWSYNGAVRPIINFVDHSGAAWPVGRAVTKWNETSGIDSIYRSASSGCDGAPVHCVHVYSGNYGSGWVGLTSRTFNSARTYYSTAKVQLNDYYRGTESENWMAACHELGHVLGLDHNLSSGGCMYGSQTSNKYPTANDFGLLERYY